MKPRAKVYLETSVISYLAARPSRDLLVAAHQQVTAEWWSIRRHDFELLVSQLVVEEASAKDALHISIAAVHGVNFLMTWNCKHIANATLRGRIERICAAAGFPAPVICTPEELVEDGNVER